MDVGTSYPIKYTSIFNTATITMITTSIITTSTTAAAAATAAAPTTTTNTFFFKPDYNMGKKIEREKIGSMGNQREEIDMTPS